MVAIAYYHACATHRTYRSCRASMRSVVSSFLPLNLSAQFLVEIKAVFREASRAYAVTAALPRYTIVDDCGSPPPDANMSDVGNRTSAAIDHEMLLVSFEQVAISAKLLSGVLFCRRLHIRCCMRSKLCDFMCLHFQTRSQSAARGSVDVDSAFSSVTQSRSECGFSFA